MEYRTLGKSGIDISTVSFGAGPVSGLMIGDERAAQCRTIQHACQSRINWFDTAPGYGDGRSESALGNALGRCREIGDIHIATKVRLTAEQLPDIPAAVRRSCEGSLQRLGVERITLLQLHNSVTAGRGDLPTSVTVADVLGEGGVVSAFESLRRDGLVEFFGFTGLGDHSSLSELVTCGAFVSAQVPLNIANMLFEEDRSAGSIDVDYGRLVEECAEHQVGVIAIRVFAGGAIVERPPSPHTFRTKFFGLDLFQRDRARAGELRRLLPDGLTMAEASIRFVLGMYGVTTALLGLESPQEADEAISYAGRGPIDADVLQRIRQVVGRKRS